MKGRASSTSSAGSKTARSTTAVMMRCFSIRTGPSGRSRGEHRLGLHAAESPVTPGVRGQSRIELRFAEVGPEAVREDKLRVGRLPEQEIADAHFPARANEE